LSSAAAPDNQAAVLVSLDLGGATPEGAAEELLRLLDTHVAPALEPAKSAQRAL